MVLVDTPFDELMSTSFTVTKVRFLIPSGSFFLLEHTDSQFYHNSIYLITSLHISDALRKLRSIDSRLTRTIAPVWCSLSWRYQQGRSDQRIRSGPARNAPRTETIRTTPSSQSLLYQGSKLLTRNYIPAKLPRPYLIGSILRCLDLDGCDLINLRYVVAMTKSFRASQVMMEAYIKS
jgi:hypothetical protein